MKPSGPTAQPRRQGRNKTGHQVLTPGEFAAELDRASRTLWCIAAAIVRDRAEAEDVVQEAAVIGLRKIQQFDRDTNFTAWMSSIVRFVALNETRRRTRRNVSLSDPGTLDRANENADRRTARVVTSAGNLTADQDAFDDRVIRALGSLDETARSCLLLRTLLDLPYREISVVLGIPEGTAMSHVHRSRAAMRRALTPTDPPASNAGDSGRGNE